MIRPRFATGHIYHIYNRGVEKRKVFLNTRDFLRFTGALHEFNDLRPALNAGRNFASSLIEVGLQSKEREKLVEILTFCLMPNHYHLLVRQSAENGITEFMRKIGTGYTNYFNLRYGRVGPLFQGKFKAVLIEKEIHFLNLPHYIHLNPLDVFKPLWRERGVGSLAAAFDFLRNYRWSSFLDYTGKKNFPAVIDREFLEVCVGGPADFYEASQQWAKAAIFDPIEDVAID